MQPLSPKQSISDTLTHTLHPMSLQPHCQAAAVRLRLVLEQVTAILVLAGLPRVMAGSILAHESMHAWLRLTGAHHLPLEVEEGLCQLMALLWLESQPSANSVRAQRVQNPRII